MKRYFILMTLVSGLGTFSFAQNVQHKDEEKNERTNQKQVPAEVKQAFASRFPGVSANWEQENSKYEANFKQMGHEMSAVFTKNGRMEESEMEINVKELPTRIIEYVKTNYKGRTIKEAAKITKEDGSINYEAEVDGKDLIFDKDGRFLKKVKE